MENSECKRWLFSKFRQCKNGSTRDSKILHVPLNRLTALSGDDAGQARSDSLAKLFKEKIDHVKRADWQEDRHDPDLR